jgi:hypothetical protein
MDPGGDEPFGLENMHGYQEGAGRKADTGGTPQYPQQSPYIGQRQYEAALCRHGASGREFAQR